MELPVLTFTSTGKGLEVHQERVSRLSDSLLTLSIATPCSRSIKPETVLFRATLPVPQLNLIRTHNPRANLLHVNHEGTNAQSLRKIVCAFVAFRTRRSYLPC